MIKSVKIQFDKLKHETGLQSLFKNVEFSKSWEVKKKKEAVTAQTLGVN